jgi:hypothetical protein
MAYTKSPRGNKQQQMQADGKSRREVSWEITCSFQEPFHSFHFCQIQNFILFLTQRK